MNSKFKIYTKWGLGLYKFIGNVELADILAQIKESYLHKDFKNLNHTLLDFRECTFAFDMHDVKKIVELVEENKTLTVNIKTGLIASEPKVTALSTVFSSKLGINKDVKIVSTISHLIKIYDLSISEKALESLFKQLI
jgi:acid phosphatase family membrane protein YuiD